MKFLYFLGEKYRKHRTQNMAQEKRYKPVRDGSGIQLAAKDCFLYWKGDHCLMVREERVYSDEKDMIICHKTKYPIGRWLQEAKKIHADDEYMFGTMWTRNWCANTGWAVEECNGYKIEFGRGPTVKVTKEEGEAREITVEELVQLVGWENLPQDLAVDADGNTYVT